MGNEGNAMSNIENQIEVRLPGRKRVMSKWNIITNLTDRWGEINEYNAELKPRDQLTDYDGALLNVLRQEMWDEITFIVQKDGKFGILYEVEFASRQSEEGLGGSTQELSDHDVVMNSIAQRLEVLATKFPGVSFCVPPESEIANDRPAAWAFVPYGMLDPLRREELGKALLGMLYEKVEQNDGITTVDVRHWEAYPESAAHDRHIVYEMQISDTRKTNGGLVVTTAPKGGNVDDLMLAVFEINTLPGTKSQTQVMHLHFGNDELAMSIFKKGDAYMLRLENGVSLDPLTLENGDHAFVLK